MSFPMLVKKGQNIKMINLHDKTVIYIFIKSILKSLVVSVIWLAQIGAIYSQIAPFFALNHIIFPANEEVTFQTCELSWRFRERLRYTVELSSNQK